MYVIRSNIEKISQVGSYCVEPFEEGLYKIAYDSKCFLGLAYKDIKSAPHLIKVANPSSSIAVQSLCRESSILQSLSHPAIVKFIDCGWYEFSNAHSKCEPTPFLVEELLKDDLATLIFKKNRRITWIQVKKIFLTICDAVSYLHRCKIIHGDIKLGNIAMLDDLNSKLIDFGTARNIEIYQEKRTFPYLSHHHSPDVEWSSLVDIYSLGVLLFNLIANGEFLVFRVTGDWNFIYRKEEIPQKIWGDLISLVLQATAWNKSERIVSISELLEKFIDISNVA
jgi:serine/threonine protein kinase